MRGVAHTCGVEFEFRGRAGEMLWTREDDQQCNLAHHFQHMPERMLPAPLSNLAAPETRIVKIPPPAQV